MSFQGSLNELPLADIVQLVAVSGKTGMFSMTRASEKGYVYLQNGHITHAKLGEVEGDDAIYALALWNQGTFQFSPGVESEARTISRSNTNLLLEAARRSDEWKILSRKIPATDSVPVLVSREGANGPVTLTPLEWKVVTKTDGLALDRGDRARLKTSAFDVAKTLYGLVTAELVEIGEDPRRSSAGRVRNSESPAAPPAIPPLTGQADPERLDAQRRLPGSFEGRREAQPPDPLHEGEAGGRGGRGRAGRAPRSTARTARRSRSSTAGAGSTSCAI